MNTLRSSRLLSSSHLPAIQYLHSFEAMASAHEGSLSMSIVGSIKPSESAARTSSTDVKPSRHISAGISSCVSCTVAYSERNTEV